MMLATVWCMLVLQKNTIDGQEYVYARDDNQKGTYSFVNYDAIDGTKQPLVYIYHITMMLLKAIKLFMYHTVAVVMKLNG